MLTPYKGRDPYDPNKVFVYRNINKGNWSLRAEDGRHQGLIVAHADEVGLADCEFRVSESGRQRVLLEKRKNVHAGVVGRIDHPEPSRSATFKACAPDLVTYNPYMHDSFRRNKKPIRESSFVWLDCFGKAHA